MLILSFKRFKIIAILGTWVEYEVVGFFAVDFLLFLAHAEGSNPVGHSLTLT